MVKLSKVKSYIHIPVSTVNRRLHGSDLPPDIDSLVIFNIFESPPVHGVKWYRSKGGNGKVVKVVKVVNRW